MSTLSRRPSWISSGGLPFPLSSLLSFTVSVTALQCMTCLSAPLVREFPKLNTISAHHCGPRPSTELKYPRYPPLPSAHLTGICSRERSDCLLNHNAKVEIGDALAINAALPQLFKVNENTWNQTPLRSDL